MLLNTHVCTHFRDGSLSAVRYRLTRTFISAVPSSPKLVCNGELVHRGFIYIHSQRVKNQRLLVLFSFNKIGQCFLLPAFSESLPIVFYAFRICERKVEYIGFSKHDDVGCFPHIYLFFVRSVHVSRKWCSTKHRLGSPVLESKTFE